MKAKKSKYSENPALSMPAFRQFIHRMTRDQLLEVGGYIKERWADLDDAKRAELKVGDVVWFDAKSRGTVYGIIKQFNRKRINLTATTGIKWKVSPQLLNLVTDKKRADEIRKSALGGSLPVNRRDAEDFANLLGGLGGRRR